MTSAKLLVIGLTVMGLSGFTCNRELDRPVRFVVPDGYRGLIAIVVDDKYPDVIEKTHTEYILRIPPDGVLRAQSMWILKRWHSERASTVSGNDLRKGDPSGVFFQGGKSMIRSELDPEIIWYFVGTDEERSHMFYTDEGRKLSIEWLNQHGVKW